MTPNTAQPTVTNADLLKSKVLEYASDLLNRFEDDIRSGINEGIYVASENKGNLQMIKDAAQAFKQFREFTPEIYLYVKGGMIQGASANCKMGVDIYDADNLDNCTDEEEQEFIELNGTAEEWDEMIKAKTAEGTLIAVY